MKIATGIKATKQFQDILSSVIGQMSDGIWENTRSMEKYWRSLDYQIDANGCLVIEDRYGVCADPVDFFANKIKQIIKIEIDDGRNSHLTWDRHCGVTPEYLERGNPLTAGDCYKLYELLKGRDTTKHNYTTYTTYDVVLTINGVQTVVTVSAVTPYAAKAEALKQVIVDAVYPHK